MIEKKFWLSPRFWALILGLVLILLQVFWPAFAVLVDTKKMWEAVGSLIAFIWAASVSDTPTFETLFKQWKFYALVISLAFIFISAFYPAFPFTEDQVLAALGVIWGPTIGYSYRGLNKPLILPTLPPPSESNDPHML